MTLQLVEVDGVYLQRDAVGQVILHRSVDRRALPVLDWYRIQILTAEGHVLVHIEACDFNTAIGWLTRGLGQTAEAAHRMCLQAETTNLEIRLEE